MRLPIRWLRDYLPIQEPATQIAFRLDSAGFEVESVDTFGKGCKALVVGLVEDFDRHPRAERLRVCKVDYGSGDPVDVVCGASNFGAGDLVAFAPPGAELPGGVRVEAKTIRGVTSWGMICSESELGIGEDAQGILVIADSSAAKSMGLEVGAPLEDVLGLGDSIIEVDITPNRPDAMSVLGLARELSASTGIEFSFPSVEYRESEIAASEKISVEIEDARLCPRYIARYISDTKVGPSPLWMASRLREAGARPINNIVDITNFVLFEVGHPLHAFDYAQVFEGRIVVRRARPGEEIATLDGETRALSDEDLVIADPKRLLAIAGVVGGEESSISASTTEILLESAYFDPKGILRTAKTHSIRTESSARFERGCDPEGAEWASKRAVSLVQQIAGGKVGKGAVDVYPNPIRPVAIRLQTSKTNKLLGTDIPSQRQAELLRSIGLKILEAEDDEVEVEVPTFRPDITRDVDLVEEVGRLYGYDNVVKTLPASRGRIGRLDPNQRVRRRIAQIVQGCGFSSVKNFSMVAPNEIPAAMQSDVSRLANPLRVEESVLRPTLIPGLLRSAGLNLSRRRQDLRLYEVGTVFGAPGNDGLPVEHRSLAGVVVSARRERSLLHSGIADIDSAPEFFLAKAALDAVFEAGHIKDVEYIPEAFDGMHPGRGCSAVLKGESLGLVAEMLPESVSRYGIESRTAVFEIDLDRVCALFDEAVPFRQYSRFPPAFFDLDFVVSDDVPAAWILDTVRAAGGELVERCQVLDVYRSPTLGEGKKSVTVTVTLAALEKTLTDEEAGGVRQRIIEATCERLGAVLRGV